MHLSYPVPGAKIIDYPVYLPEELVQLIAESLSVEDFVNTSIVSKEAHESFKKFHMLPQKHEAVARCVVNHVLNSRAHCLITGPAGTGKTYALRMLYERAIKEKKKIYMTALTALAASNLPDGMTLHSCLNIPVGDNRRKVSKAALNADIIVIDEVSMLSAGLLEAIDLYISEDRHRTDTMGGVQLVFCGDFYQLQPVSGRPCTESRLWKSLRVHTLHMGCPVRQAKDMSWFHALNHIRCGIPPKHYLELLLRRYSLFDIQKHIDGKYGPLLVATNKKRAEYNQKCLAAREEEIEELSALDSLYRIAEDGKHTLLGWRSRTNVSNNGYMSSAELNRLLDRGAKSSRLPDILKLQKGAMYTHLVNHESLYNGSALRYEGNQHGQGFLFRDVNTNEFHNVEGCSRAIQLSETLVFERKQVPVDLGYALTFHRSQGMTLEKAAIDARGLFARGQLYSGLSRIRTLEGLTLVGFESKAFQKNPEADNVYEKLRKEEICSAFIDCK